MINLSITIMISDRLKKFIFLNWEWMILIILIILIGGRFPGIYWSFVDDGELIIVSQQITDALSSLDPHKIFKSLEDPAIGRFRPAYWIYHWLVYLMGGTNHFWHGAIHILLFLIIVIGIYFITKIMSDSRRAGFFAGLLFVLNAVIQENWYRLGPQEAPMMTFFVLSLLFFMLSLKFREDLKLFFYLQDFKERISKIFRVSNWGLTRMNFISNKEKWFYLLSIVFLVPAYFMKESAIAFVTFPLIFYLSTYFLSENYSKFLRPRLLYYLLINLFLALITRILSILKSRAGSYTEEYQLDFATMFSSAQSYFGAIRISLEPIISLVLFVFMVQAFYHLQMQRNLNFKSIVKVLTLLTAFSFFIIQLPWSFTVNRYLLPMMVFLVIFMALQLDDIIKFFEEGIKRRKQIPQIELGLWNYFLLIFIWVIISMVFWYNFITMQVYIGRIVNLSNNFNRPLIEYLSQNTSSGGFAYLNTQEGTALELKQEIGLHLDLFYSREDIKVKYFDPSSQDLPKIGDILLNAGEFKELTKESYEGRLKYSDPKKIEITIINTLYYPPLQLLKEYPRRWVWNKLTKMPLDINPILVTNQDKYWWEIYKIL